MQKYIYHLFIILLTIQALPQNLLFRKEYIKIKNLIETNSHLQLHETITKKIGFRLLHSTIQRLRALHGPLKSFYYFTTDKDQEGLWRYDPSDSISTDNTGSILITSDGKRFKRQGLKQLSIKFFGAKGDGVSNDGPAMQKALSTPGSIIYFPPGIYNTNNFIKLASKVNMIGEGSRSIIAATNDIPNDPTIKDSHQGQIIILGSNCTVQNMKIDGRNHKAGGFCVVGVRNCSINKCIIINGGSSQAILDCVSSNTKYTNNTMFNCLSGIQLWMSDHCFIARNSTSNCNAGIWGASPSYVDCKDNKIKNCDDVGLDWEGGKNINSIGNTIASCNNGEMSVFMNNTIKTGAESNISFLKNSTIRTANYINRSGKTVPVNANAGSVQVSSISSGSKNIIFSNNSIVVKSGYAFFTNDITAANTEIYFTNNNIKSSDKFFRVQGTDGLVIKDNYFEGIEGSAQQTSEIKNSRSFILEGNTFIQIVPKVNTPVLLWYTDRKLDGKKPILIRNKFINTGDLAFKHDPYVSGTPCILESNIFTDTYTANGGVTFTANGAPLYINQNLKIRNSNGTHNVLMNTSM